MTQQSVLRRRRMRVVAGTAAAVLAIGGLTACEETGIPGEGAGDSQERDAEDAEQTDTGDTDTGDTDTGDTDTGDTDTGETDDAGDDGSDASDASDGGDRLPDGDFLGDGDTFTTADGIEVTLGGVEEFTPSDYVDHTGTAYKFGVSVSNGTDEDIDVAILYKARAGERGVEAERLFDNANLDSDPFGTLKPGRTASGEIAFDLPEDAEFVDINVRFVGDLDNEGHWSFGL
ncbi:DUF4352 domain-containing protein [Streptomyces sp. SM12]|uniref:DUF4352 domain-containing protein n=1 Tax=Streptomyces sp. SM12 TaxID=1071602 RepID=UPI0011B02025|nr:DUF4352 domain-containing protein [Streptomyces sp. SM12]